MKTSKMLKSASITFTHILWRQTISHDVFLIDSIHAFFVYYENADLVYEVIRMRQLSKQTLHELSPNDNS